LRGKRNNAQEKQKKWRGGGSGHSLEAKE